MANVYQPTTYNYDDDSDFRPPRPPNYCTPTTPKPAKYIEEVEVPIQEIEPVECTPHMCCIPMQQLRFFEGFMLFVLQWLVQITCGDDACTMIMNVFGYIAMGQAFVLIILLVLSIPCVLILIAYSLNAHKTAYAPIMLAVERIYAILGIPLMFIAGLLGTWMAIQTTDTEVYYQGRGWGKIRPQWIAAAVLEFLMVFVFAVDYHLQKREGYPFTVQMPSRRLKHSEEGSY